MSLHFQAARRASTKGQTVKPVVPLQRNGSSPSEATQVVHRLFEERAVSSPRRVAAAYENHELTYEALNQRANRLAHFLLRMDVGPEKLVGLCVERSLEALVGILAILKTGAAYLPLDPRYPGERLAFMLSDANVKVLLTEEQLVPQLPHTDAAAICLDTMHEEIEKQSVENPTSETLPDNPAYVIYTSGSSGRPKGVVVTHANVVRLFDPAWFDFSPQDVWTLFHSFAFDFSVWEMWGALLHGGKVVIVPYFVSRTPDAFYDLLCREKVTVLSQTPSAFRQLIKAEEKRNDVDGLALRRVVFGGEALEVQSLKPWIERHEDEHPQLINMFGITETTVHVTHRRILRQDVEAGQGSFIGQAIPDLQLYVLDETLNPLPPGQTGELYVGGAGVSRGYLHRPELTAERFIPDPFSRAAGARLYRTGDLGRLLPGNDAEYLGRLDQQVKVRGFRIELGEIESVIAQFLGIRECLVTTHDDEDEGKRLAAYVVFNADQPRVEELYRYLLGRLPEYMVPSSIVPLQQMPLTAHGKVDRQALPVPEWLTDTLLATNAPPRNSVEKTLADVWIESLGLRTVGIDDNYFALGGDSIRSIKVRAKALERGLQFSLQQLFQNPTIRGLAAALGAGEGEAGSKASGQPFSMIAEEDRRKLPANAVDAYPLSLLQSGMTFHSEYSPDYIIYVSSLHLQIKFDAEKMRQALDHVAAQHEMLRTSFDLRNFSIPLQIVHGNARHESQVEDLRYLSPREQERRIDEWLRAEARQGFDWTQAPLFRFRVHLRGQDAIQFTMSEPFLDGWSVASLLTELFECYLALLHGNSAPAKPPAAAYKDFVALEQEAIRSEQCRSYWSKLLDGVSSHLPLRGGPTRVGAQEVVRLPVPLSRATSDGLKDVAREAGVSLKSVLLAAHMKVVSIFSGQSEVVTGVLTSGRPECQDGERLIGAFLNTLPFRMRLAGGTWIELAQRAHAIESEMLPFRRYPIQEMQRLYGAEKKLDTIFNYTHFHVMHRLQSKLAVNVLEMKGSEQTYYPLTAQFSVNEFSSVVELALDYRTLELGEDQVTRIAGCYVSVLDSVARHSFGRHDTLILLSREEELRLVQQLNETCTPFPEDLCLHEMFAAQAQRTPHAAAAVAGEERLTYEELEHRANQLARYLRRRGVGPETLVGICVERGADMIAGLLGILKAGGAYLPLDPEYPPERLEFMLRDARAKTVITQKRLLERFSRHDCRRICLDSDWPLIACEDCTALASAARPDNLAYVIYTSGSTGKPKGVLIEHRGVVNTIEASIRRFGIGRNSRVAQLASLSFDASVLEIFTALLAGGTLYVAQRERVMSGQELASFLKETAITTMAIPPSLLDLIPFGEYPALCSIVVGGETCGAQTAACWSAGRRFFNAYAPTEATIYATSGLCRERELEAPPIGRPIQNMQVYLLDEYGQPVPIEVPGELHIGGVGLARGYLGQAELTAERFVPNPFSAEPGARLYKTGDRARFLADGNIQFIGRTDQQVKMRGFRIELGEIEAALGTHSWVREVAVVAREDSPNNKRIVAYVVPHEGRAPNTSDLRRYLKTRLPDYMLPSAFVVLETMPLSETGKIDRAALPAPAQMRPDLASDYAEPRSPLEKVVAGIFGEVLEIERVGIADNFFELGGHSLMATRVVSRIRTLFSIDFPLRALFEEPTVGGLASSMVMIEDERERIDRTAELLLQISTLPEEQAAMLLQESESLAGKDPAS